MHILRDRTADEIRIIKKNFLNLVEILRSININFMIDAGLLLGIYRDGDLIKWDWDIEFSLYDNVFSSNIEDLLIILKKQGFRIHKIDKSNHKLEVYKDLPYEVFSYTFKGWYHDKGQKSFKRKNFFIPEKFFLEKTQINYLGHSFSCPGPIEGYLEFIYGDWSKPKRSDQLDTYLSKDYYKKESWILSVIKKIYYRIKNLK